jgi:two-component system NarL family sensor kinase
MLLKQKTTALFLLIFFIYLNVASQLPQSQMDSLVNELAKAKEDTNKVNLLKTLANEIGYTDFNKALEYGQQGYELSQKLNYEKGMGIMAYIIGFTYTDLGNFPLSDSFLNIAETKFQMLGFPGQLAKVEHARGVKNYKQGNYWLAADFFAKCVKLFEDAKDDGSALIAYQSLISVLGQIKNHNKAVELSKKALKLAENMKDSLSIGYSLQTLVTDLIYLHRLDEASKYISQLEEFAGKTMDQNRAAESYSTLGMFSYERKKISLSILYFQKAFEIAKQLGDNYQVANHLNSLGQSQLELGLLSESKNNLMESLRLAKDFDNKRAEYNASLSLSKYFKKINEHENAYNQLFHHLEMKDSILKTETSNYTTYLEESYAANKRENEILRLQKVQQEKEFALKKRNTYLAIGAGLIAVLITILYLLRRNFQHKQKLAQQRSVLFEEKIKTIEQEQQISSLQSMIIGQETERTRIAKDLHGWAWRYFLYGKNALQYSATRYTGCKRKSII